MVPFTPETEGVWVDLPMETYRDAPGVARSTLTDFDSFATPLHFKVSLSEKKRPTYDMNLGTVFHGAILEPDKIKSLYYVRPDTYEDEESKKPKKWNGNANVCKAWFRAHSDRVVIERDDEAKIPSVVGSVRRVIGSALDAGQTEVSYFKRDEVTGLMLKCRTDVIVTDGRSNETWIFDPKKVQPGCASEKEFTDEVLNRGYHVQAASYLHITGASHFVFVPFDDGPPYGCATWEPDEELLEFGIIEWRRILNTYAECLRTDTWPGYKEGLNKLRLKGWAKAQLKAAKEGMV